MAEIHFKIISMPANHPKAAAEKTLKYYSPTRTYFTVVNSVGRRTVQCNAVEPLELAVGEVVILPPEWDDDEVLPEFFKVLLLNKYAEVEEIQPQSSEEKQT